jgi:lauroyl/myristoyl acyltransferase
VAAVAPAAVDAPAVPSGTLTQRLGAWALSALSWTVSRLPEAPLRGLAELGGLVWYALAPGRRAQARRNLGRIAAALAADGRALPYVAEAARSPRALERLVRRAFRHLGLYYFEVARSPALARERVTDRIDDRSGGLFDRIVADGLGMGRGPGRGTILVGLHLGALEFPSYVLEEKGLVMTAPMEVIGNPPLQAYFMRTRTHAGLRLIPQEASRVELLAALARGEAVGLVSDRVVRGRGGPATLFGHATRFPMAAPLLSLETGAPIHLAAVWRIGGGTYAGMVERVDVPAGADRGARIRGYLAAQASVFERFIAEAPEQWWTIFFPIWPDLEAAATGRATGDAS